MKKKITRIWAVGLITILLVSLFGFAVPASAGDLSWGAQTIPDDVGKVVIPNTDISDMSVSGDGQTVYVTDNQSNKIYKSTNAGETWSEVTAPSSTYISTSVQLVAVAPDDPNVVGIVADNKEVYVSTDGGTTWKTALATVQESSADATAAYLFDIDMSVAKSGVNYVAVSGVDSTGRGNVWYYNLGVGGYWHETNDLGGFATSLPSNNISSASWAGAVAFSPNFASDSVLTAVIATDNTGTGATQNITFNMFSTSTSLWNNSYGFGTGYAVILDSSTTITKYNAASISLSPNYLGDDDAERIGFVGLAVTGDTTTNGVYQLKDESKKNVRDTDPIWSVAYDGTNLVAGRSDNNYVYYTDEPLVTTPTFSTARALKRPNGASNVRLAWADGVVLAGTSGNESAFSTSVDSGRTFNDISLIDTGLNNLQDVAVATDGSVVYLASDNGTDLSVWRKGTSWQRILSVTGAVGNGFILRIAPDNADVIYVAKKDAKTIYYSSDGGVGRWFTRTCKYDIQDLAVESASVAYVAVNNAKTVSKTTNGGFTWGDAKATNLVDGNAYTIKSLSEGNVIVASEAGYIAYSTDSGATFTYINKIIQSGATGAQVTASGLASGNYIYATSNKTGAQVYRWQIGTSTDWTDLEDVIPTTYKAFGIELVSGVLYVATANGTSASGDSAVIRTLSPTVSIPLTSYWSTLASAGETFNRGPVSLKVSAGSTKLWAIDNAGVAVDSLFAFTDILATAGPTLTTPVNGKAITVNPITGKSYDVSFVWAQPPKGREYKYDLWIAFDSAFGEKASSISYTTTSSAPAYIVGPSGTTVLDFMPGTTYYWKVRVATDGPAQSPWSEVRSFTIQPGEALVPTVLSPANGKDAVSQTPSFSWQPVGGATQYQFVLSTHVDLTAPIVDTKVTSTGYAVTTKLTYATTYYWAVKPITPVEGGWSAISNFTVMAEPKAPAPPIVITSVPPPVFTMPAPAPATSIVIPPPPEQPAPIAPAYIWAVIIIGAILVIAVIILIVRTRRAV